MSKPINPVKGKMMGGTFDMTPDLRQARRPSFLNTLTMDHEGRSLPEGKYDSNGSPRIIHDNPSIIHDNPSIIHGSPRIIHDNPSIIHDNPSIIHDNPSIIHNNPSTWWSHGGVTKLSFAPQMGRHRVPRHVCVFGNPSRIIQRA